MSWADALDADAATINPENRSTVVRVMVPSLFSPITSTRSRRLERTDRPARWCRLTDRSRRRDRDRYAARLGAVHLLEIDKVPRWIDHGYRHQPVVPARLGQRWRRGLLRIIETDGHPVRIRQHGRPSYG